MTESHNSMKTGIPNRQKTASNPLLLAESITSGASLGRLAQRLGGSSRATITQQQSQKAARNLKRVDAS
jgi:hypothetical protein